MSLGKRIYDATWGRGFAKIYDSFIAGSEEAGLRGHRQALLAGASGDVVEIGSGTGVNIELYPETVGSLTFTEPFGPMASQLREKLAASGRDATVLEAPAEQLPLPDDSADTVVATLVLCTVEDQASTLAELRGSFGRAEGCCSSSMSARIARRAPAGRIASTGPGNSSAMAATATSTRWPRSGQRASRSSGSSRGSSRRRRRW